MTNMEHWTKIVIIMTPVPEAQAQALGGGAGPNSYIVEMHLLSNIFFTSLYCEYTLHECFNCLPNRVGL